MQSKIYINVKHHCLVTLPSESAAAIGPIHIEPETLV